MSESLPLESQNPEVPEVVEVTGSAQQLTPEQPGVIDVVDIHNAPPPLTEGHSVTQEGGTETPLHPAEQGAAVSVDPSGEYTGHVANTESPRSAFATALEAVLGKQPVVPDTSDDSLEVAAAERRETLAAQVES